MIGSRSGGWELALGCDESALGSERDEQPGHAECLT